MKTDQLALALANDLAPVDPRGVRRRFGLTLGAAVLLPLLAVLLLLGPRADWRGALQLPMFWMKLGFPAVVAAAALVVLHRLAYPGLRPGRAWGAVVLPFILAWALGLAVLARAPEESRLGLLMGSAGWLCPVLIALLAIPAMWCALRALRGLAPTRLTAAGAVAGLFAGGAAACAYALACTEMQVPYLAFWYAVGMLVPSMVGAGLGRWLLRW
ncbi:DUF1109 domain-containing protein [Caenimonas sedimenti]|uniref:DUF1109 domain-containing protein n=1 Tax=Caenimonas sedimenti TaxID=2596921 RepID=A0A562ZTZ4_9BURK|nr:DUF1109 domain-containing protein [Caenimonas sedimenti]TWO71755.1 DUF1109 domain-containing protein [Caenimonas sedimenti]